MVIDATWRRTSHTDFDLASAGLSIAFVHVGVDRFSVFDDAPNRRLTLLHCPEDGRWRYMSGTYGELPERGALVAAFMGVIIREAADSGALMQRASAGGVQVIL